MITVAHSASFDFDQYLTMLGFFERDIFDNKLCLDFGYGDSLASLWKFG